MQAGDNPMTPTVFRVHRRWSETHDTFTLELTNGKPDRRFPAQPGQFNMLSVPGVGEVPISASGNVLAPFLLHTTRAVGAVTKALQRLRPGDALGVRGPFGRGWPVEQAEGRDVLFVAGGIGLAPLRPAVYRVLDARGRFNEVAVLYGARSERDLVFPGELSQWQARRDIQFLMTVDHAEAGWQGDVGVVTNLIERARFDPGNVAVFICGPEVMMRFCALELEKRGVPDRDIHLSMERNMKCALGTCGHCQFGPYFVCKDGPVFSYRQVRRFLRVREL